MKRQQDIPGTERPQQDPDIEDALYAWFDADAEARAAVDKKKIKHASLLLLVKESGREFYPYLDPKTGKKRRIRIKSTEKIATERDTFNRREKDAELADVGEEVEAKSKDADVVEKRTVRRKDVESEIDPFAATRRAMDDLADKPSDDGDPVVAKSDGSTSSVPKRGGTKRASSPS